ncbi:PKD-like family lipoprotein [Marinifilum sp.]|uniref:PKD-like family lipoprotein n=1 Tax=Marinifilum sp. TaxID=2033137 RepID=UPI003BA8C7EE
MKTLKYLIYTMVLMVALSSCLDDEGNYDYIDLPEMDLSQIPDEAQGIIGERLVIPGDISTNLTDADMSYVWAIKLEDENRDFYMDTISTSRDLDVLINFQPGKQDLFFTVVDNKNGVKSDKMIDLSIDTPFSTGWALLKEKNGKAELDFISQITNTYYTDVFTNISEVSFDGKPLNIGFYWSTYTPFSSMFILTENGGGFFDAFSMKLNASVQERFHGLDQVELPFTNSIIANLARSVPTFIAGGKIYGKGGYVIDDEAWWETPAAGDYYATGVAAEARYDNIIFFDSKNRRYITYGKRGWSPDVYSIAEVTASAGAPFDPENLQKDCIWIGNDAFRSLSSGNRNYAVLKDDAGAFFIQKFALGYSGFTAELELAVEDGKLDDNSVYTCNPALPFVYLSKGNSLHRFNTITEAFEYDHLTVEGDIKDMAVSRDGSILGIVLDEGNGSKVIFYDVNNGNTITETYTTDSKVKKLKFKEDYNPYA